jgi:hypothetical protein
MSSAEKAPGVTSAIVLIAKQRSKTGHPRPDFQ